jgi:hypothetical protein
MSASFVPFHRVPSVTTECTASFSRDDIMDRKAGAAGLAALAICESLLLALTESKTLAAGEACSILDDDAANRNAIALTPDGGHHEAAATVIELILAGGNSVRFD